MIILNIGKKSRCFSPGNRAVKICFAGNLSFKHTVFSKILQKITEIIWLCLNLIDDYLVYIFEIKLEEKKYENLLCFFDKGI